MENDAALLERIRHGDPGAFEEFVELHGSRILGFGLKVCGEREDAKDILQETLLAAFRSLKTLEDPGAMRTWLYRVASNACLMKRRRGRFAPKTELSLDDLGPLGPEGVVAELPDPAELPDESLARSELAGAIREAIQELPPHYRLVLILRDMEGLTTQEVAVALGIEISAAKMRLHRARLMVRRHLESRLAAGGGDREAAP